MVSTRGLKLRFFEGERVLCYEPDPTKAKVLYDSKVLDIVFNKDHRGRKSIEYLIHFQGWNSSWDRCVSEEFVLKDTPENRQLQKDLAEKAQLQLGAYLYRKERKKNRKPGDRASASEDGSSSSPGRMDTDDGQGITSSSEDDSSTEDETIYIELTADLRKVIEQDYYMIKEKNKFLKVPAEPNVATILETYYRHYATNQICGLTEKPAGRYRNPSNQQLSGKTKSEYIQRNLTVCREVLDGLRIYFDFTLNDLLLYKEEIGQIATKKTIFEPFSGDPKNILKSQCDIGNDSNNGDYLGQNGNDTDKITARRRTLRSNRSDSQANGNVSPHENSSNSNYKPASSVTSGSSDITGPLSKTLTWKILPDYAYHQQPPPPSLVYGATHLVRLFVKLPELLMSTNIPEDKMKLLIRHFDLLIEYLNDHKDWFGEHQYINLF
ncbi:male-specific lethal 3 homolog isoform X2 [Diorhabda carinulata]|uniref:male-specific lethal 3 homolog n=1 Tax=Diorhabda sublineata TaxID=1163346 RepID=UPI0024E04B18|nr:male-specific lethal 3 homolog [Diorhabda sublineata]XP_057663178.1 male-specific lethal 3 homolog isoform X2 [Diorhabda carinulata]